MNTYTNGFRLTSLKIIKKQDFYILCKMLEQEFNSHYNTIEYEFEPEPITEGGILFKNMPGKKDKMYKSIRIYISHLGKYGHINDNSLEEWKNNQDILCNDKIKIETFLKSFNSAPIWTIEELNIFKKCFEYIGFKCTNFPKKSDLICSQ
jgi:hypothetical protein